MDYEGLIYNIDGGIATLTLNRPEKLNSLTPNMLKGMVEIVEGAIDDQRVKVFVITGTGRAFCTGADVRNIEQDLKGQSTSLADAGGNNLPLLFQQMNKPVIAAINGVTAGGGFDISLACDIRIASEKATFSTIFVRRGLMPVMGGAYFLPRLIGIDKAFELIWTGDLIDAKEAERIGLVTKVVPHEDLESATKELAAKLVKRPPLAIAKVKQAIYKGLSMDLESSLAYARRELDDLKRSEDHREAVTAFLEKREPVFKGR